MREDVGWQEGRVEPRIADLEGEVGVLLEELDARWDRERGLLAKLEGGDISGVEWRMGGGGKGYPADGSLLLGLGQQSLVLLLLEL